MCLVSLPVTNVLLYVNTFKARCRSRLITSNMKKDVIDVLSFGIKTKENDRDKETNSQEL